MDLTHALILFTPAALQAPGGGWREQATERWAMPLEELVPGTDFSIPFLSPSFSSGLNAD